MPVSEFVELLSGKRPPSTLLVPVGQRCVLRLVELKASPFAEPGASAAHAWLDFVSARGAASSLALPDLPQQRMTFPELARDSAELRSLWMMLRSVARRPEDYALRRTDLDVLAEGKRWTELVFALPFDVPVGRAKAQLGRAEVEDLAGMIAHWPLGQWLVIAIVSAELDQRGDKLTLRLPAGLRGELERDARRYGMSAGQMALQVLRERYPG